MGVVIFGVLSFMVILLLVALIVAGFQWAKLERLIDREDYPDDEIEEVVGDIVIEDGFEEGS